MLRFSEKTHQAQITPAAASRPAPALSLCVLIALLSVLVLSCATIPSIETAGGWLGVLPDLTPDSLYVSADVASSLGLLEVLALTEGGESPELKRAIGNLERVHARIRLSPGASAGKLPELSLIALGQLSPGSVACKLNLDPSWERMMLERTPGRGFSSSHWSHRTYWRKEQLEIAVPQRGVLFASAGAQAEGDLAVDAPAGYHPAGVEALLRRLHAPKAQGLPARALGDLQTADIFVYIPDPVAAVSLQAASAATAPSSQDPGKLLQNLPIRQGWISARRRGQGYELGIVFLLEEADNPRSVELLLRLMLTLWLRKVQVEDPVKILKQASITADSEAARIDSLYLEEQQIVFFFATLFPGSLSAGQL